MNAELYFPILLLENQISKSEGELADLVGELDYIVSISAASVPCLEVKLVGYLASWTVSSHF